LQRHRIQQLEECQALGPIWDNTYDLVFPNTLGRPMDASHLIRREFHPLLKQAGLPHMRFHDLRHTAATLLLRQGVNPKIVSEMLGHASVSITLDLYSHVLPDMQQIAAEAMDTALGESSASPVALSSKLSSEGEKEEN
jgi:integrase